MINFLKKTFFLAIYGLAISIFANITEEEIAQDFLDKATENIKSFQDPFTKTITALHFLDAEKKEDIKTTEEILTFSMKTLYYLQEQENLLAEALVNIGHGHEKFSTETFIADYPWLNIRCSAHLTIIQNYPNLSTEDRNKYWKEAKKAAFLGNEEPRSTMLKDIAMSQACYDLTKAEKTAHLISIRPVINLRL